MCIRDRIEKEREGETGHPAPAAYGRYNNVILTDTELSGLKTELPDKWEYYIDRLSCHIASTGKQYHSHAATIYKWAQEDATKGKAAPKQGIPCLLYTSLSLKDKTTEETAGADVTSFRFNLSDGTSYDLI